MFPAVLQTLLGRVPDGTSAEARGWRAAVLPARVYPGLVAGDKIVKGRLITELTPEEWQILDAFEDPTYDLNRLELIDGRHGWAYVCRRSDVAPEDWSIDEFEDEHLATYVERCALWKRRYEARGSW